MSDRWVVDASVLGAAFFNEAGSSAARTFLTSGVELIAPDLLFAEIASIAAKKVWRGEAPEEAAIRAVRSLDQFVSRFVGAGSLAEPATALAIHHRFSAYDAIYLALADVEGLKLATLDQKLAQRANAAGLAPLVGSPI